MGRATGGQTALPIWVSFMAKALAFEPAHDFLEPEGVTLVKIDPTTGDVSERESAVEQAFIAGTEPQANKQPLRSIFIEDEGLGLGAKQIP